MRLSTSILLPLASLIAAAAPAQGFDFLFATSQPERTRSGSAGTVLRNLQPNEIASLQFSTANCPSLSAEKWSPRTCFQTMAGDENSDGMYWDPTIFGSIDALVAVMTPIAGGMPSQRTVFFSPSAAMGTGVSGVPGLRPGDTGRIVRNGSGDGQVEYFLRAEDVQMALGMPATPLLVDVDEVAFSPNYGVFFSLAQDTVVNTTCGVTFVRDGDLLMIPPYGITYTPDMRVQSVLPGCAQVVYTEAQMDVFVFNARITDRFGACVTQIQDLKALEIDWSTTGTTLTTCPGTVLTVPDFLFSGELMTGGGLCTTAGGGMIYNAPCGPLGTFCGMGPTLGLQVGLLPPSAALGIPSYVSAIDSTRHARFVTEARQPVFFNGLPAQIDVANPAPMAWMFLDFAPAGINAVAPSFPFPPSFAFPDRYVSMFAGAVVTPGGFGTYTSPAIPWPCKLVWQAVTLNTAGGIDLSTPTTTDIL